MQNACIKQTNGEKTNKKKNFRDNSSTVNADQICCSRNIQNAIIASFLINYLLADHLIGQFNVWKCQAMTFSCFGRVDHKSRWSNELLIFLNRFFFCWPIFPSNRKHSKCQKCMSNFWAYLDEPRDTWPIINWPEQLHHHNRNWDVLARTQIGQSQHNKNEFAKSHSPVVNKSEIA